MVDIITNFLDLEAILINELFGSIKLFTFIGALVVLLIAIKSKMPFQVQFVFLMLWMTAIFSSSLDLTIWMNIALVMGAVFYYLLSRPFRRG
jgi:hypothetical protein